MNCEHCGDEIPYHRGRTITVCMTCRLKGHKGDPDTCEKCKAALEDDLDKAMSDFGIH